MEQRRPDPDALLAQVQAEEHKARRGKLTIFFGASAGVGKTYAMLSRGREKYVEGLDVVVGYAEPHARPETEALLLGMDLLPYRFVDYRGANLKEFDLDAALARKPELILVDELAHTNADGLRHAKRWQDVEELLQAGIDVYTTLNVQHLESLNDVVAQISGVTVRETLPDAVFESADEVILIDLTPDELLERLTEGKVYVSQQAALAIENFFKKSNLTALRELSLRKTADRVNAQVLSARQQSFARQTWPTTDRVLVAISPSPTSTRVIRAAKRLAVSLRAEWIAAYVETPSLQRLGEQGRARLMHNVHLAERLGAEVVTLSGDNVAEEIVAYARSRNVTKMVIGKTEPTRWRDRLLGSPMDALMRLSGEIDVYAVRGEREEAVQPIRRELRIPTDWRPYLKAAAIVGLVTLICAGMFPFFGLANLIMVYLLGVAIAAARYGRGPAALASALSVLAFDIGFVPPQGTFAVSDTQYFVTFLVMFAVAMLISRQTARIRDQARASRERERRTAALYGMTRALSDAKDRAGLVALAVAHIREVFGAPAMILMPDERGQLTPSDVVVITKADLGVAQWVFEHGQVAGNGTDTLPSSPWVFFPLTASRGAVGVLGFMPPSADLLLRPEQRPVLDAFVGQIALAVERSQFAADAQRSQVQAESERLRSSLLSAVSHDLRTPLAVIAGASSTLLEGSATDPDAARELAQTIYDESNRLSTLVNNLLDVTRLQAGAVTLNKQWNVIEEIVGSALNRLEKRLTGHSITTNIPADLPLVPVDGVLIEQALINLIENAAKYTPPGTPIDVTVRASGGEAVVEVADRGPGLADAEAPRVFEKFYRGIGATGQRGAGLGLTICAAIVQVHGGRIWAENRKPPEHGAVFRFTLPLGEPPPPIDESPEAIPHA